MDTPGQKIAKAFEECRLVAYQDSGGVWTIGWGHTGPEVKKGLVWTQQQADTHFQSDWMMAQGIVVDNVTAPLSDNELEALTDFVFNVGPGKAGEKDGFVVQENGEPSTMLKLINAEDYQGAAREFSKWIYVRGVPTVGLQRRRSREALLFIS